MLTAGEAESMKSEPHGTVIAALERAAAEFGARPALAWRTGDGWETISQPLEPLPLDLAA